MCLANNPDVAPRLYAGGAGVREGGHLPAGEAEARRRQGARHLLHPALHRPLQEGRPYYLQLSTLSRVSTVSTISPYLQVDLRTVSFDVPPQEILSRDSVTVTVDAVIYYRVFNPIMVRGECPQCCLYSLFTM